MKKFTLTTTALAIGILMMGCSTAPKTTSLLNQTRSDYSVAQSTPQVMTNAPLEMKQAGDALDKANKAASNDDSNTQIDDLAYIAKQKIAVAQEVNKQKIAEAEIANASKERDQVRLDQRTKEADLANAKADQAKMGEQIAQNETINAQNETANAQNRAAQLETELAALAAKKTERGIVITLGDVLFGTDLARLTSDGEAKAQKLADILQQNPQRTVLIEGYTDSTGSVAHNQELSERRSGSVRTALLKMGVADNRIAVRGYGETHPVASNTSAADRQLNRRVEIVLSDADGQMLQRQ